MATVDTHVHSLPWSKPANQTDATFWTYDIGCNSDISVDYAVFEKTHLAAVLPVSFPWSDLGSWDAVWKMSPKHDGNNVTRGAVTLSNTTNSLIVSEGAHVAVEGLDDIAVVVSEDAIYVG